MINNSKGKCVGFVRNGHRFGNAAAGLAEGDVTGREKNYDLLLLALLCNCYYYCYCYDCVSFRCPKKISVVGWLPICKWAVSSPSNNNNNNNEPSIRGGGANSLCKLIHFKSIQGPAKVERTSPKKESYWEWPIICKLPGRVAPSPPPFSPDWAINPIRGTTRFMQMTPC